MASNSDRFGADGVPARPGSGAGFRCARLFLAVGLPAAVVVVALGVLSWRTTRAAVEASLQRERGSVVAAAANTVNPRTGRAVLPEEQRESRTYRRTVEKLRDKA